MEEKISNADNAITGQVFEVVAVDKPNAVVALVYEITTNTLTQEGYSLWIQLQQDWLNISAEGLVIRPNDKEAVTESQFNDMAKSWIEKNGAPRAWVVKHNRQTPMIYASENDTLSSEELASIPSPVFELGSVKMAVPAGRFLVSKKK